MLSQSTRYGLAIVLLGACGCTHLHDDGNAALARAAVEEFATFRTSSSDPYATMLRNQAKLASSKAEERGRAYAQSAESLAIQLGDQEWGQIQTDLTNVRERLKESKPTPLPAEIRGLCTTSDLVAELENSRSDQQEARKLLERALARQREAEARRVLFNESMRFVAARATQDEGMDKKALEQAREQVLNREITYLKLDTVVGKISDATSTVGESLPKTDLDVLKKGHVGDVLRSYTVAQFDPETQPGLIVVLLSLALDLVQTDIERLTLCGEYRKSREDALKEASSLDLTDNAIAYLKEGSLALGETVTATLNRARRARGPQAQKTIQAAFRVLAGYVVTQTIFEEAGYDASVRIEDTQHLYSIRLAAISAREREALIGRGLQGLQVYHEGGLTAEDVANLIRAAQVVATAVIAGGIY